MSALRISAPIVIFVRPQAAGNIGALSRVMSNFGVSELRLVGPRPADSDNDDEFSKMDWALSCKGSRVLETATRHATLQDALEGLHIALGTSGKKDGFFELGYARPFVSPTKALADLDTEIASSPEPLRWALVLGPEDDGLNAEEASLCKQLVHIATVDQNPSINLAMAAGLFLYHWHLLNLGEISNMAPSTEKAMVAGAQSFPLEPGDRLATLDEKEAFLDYVVEALKLTQFFKTPDVVASRARLRRWLQSSQSPLMDLRTLFEAVYQLKCWGQGRFEGRDFLKKRS
ncbi:MAG: RNA methyltransferase [Bdellovibrionota bacterium]